ncbi:MAG TPA: M14 family metallopeptidase [Pirellulales bacterium]|nr:M14 family metallopeptidase [Pirellulales bacterium]
MSDFHALQTERIVGARPGPHLLIFGGVHGDEFEPMVAIRRLARSVRGADLRGALTLVPVVNEPAFLRGHRLAEDGLDLARTFPGRADGSITEQIAHAATRIIVTADLLIDLHTGGTTMSLWPLAGYSLHPDAGVLEKQRRMARAFNLPFVWGTSPHHEGRSLSVARDANIPAIYTEFHGAATCDPAGVDAYVSGCLNVMAEFEMIDRREFASATKLVVEDPRSGSGHLQINNPAPCRGYFEPAVCLGQSVRTGDLLGTISDPLGKEVTPIPSRQDGVVVLLRTFPRVLEGDCLAVIVEVEQNLAGT